MAGSAWRAREEAGREGWLWEPCSWGWGPLREAWRLGLLREDCKDGRLGGDWSPAGTDKKHGRQRYRRGPGCLLPRTESSDQTMKWQHSVLPALSLTVRPARPTRGLPAITFREKAAPAVWKSWGGLARAVTGGSRTSPPSTPPPLQPGPLLTRRIVARARAQAPADAEVGQGVGQIGGTVAPAQAGVGHLLRVQGSGQWRGEVQAGEVG